MNQEVEMLERRKQNIKEQIEAAIKIEYLSRQFKDLSDYVKEHMKNEDDERRKLNRKLLIIAAVVLVDAVAPGGGAAVLKAFL